ncbi:MAG: pimeloyl-CoA dehydrogenase small subunit [Candidatus Velthaea sp.]
MDFTLSAEQLMIKDSVERYAAGAKTANDWTNFANLGWLAIGTPEELGGFGGPIETMIVMEAFGRGLVSEPYVAQIVFAGGVLRAAGRSDLLETLADGSARFAIAYEESHGRYDAATVQTNAARDGESYVLSGRKVRALGASTANTIVVSARTGDEITLFAVPADAQGLSRTAYASEDGHDATDITFEGVRVGSDAVVGSIGAGLTALERGLDAATAALCAEGVGLMSVMLEATVDYTKQRNQFGVPIGSFQALQHRMAEMFMELELARSMAIVAAMALEDGAGENARKRGVSSAKVQIARSGRFIGQNAIQLHGGIGMSEEYKIGHYFKRMTMVERLFGDMSFHLTRFVALREAKDREPAAV